MKPEESDEFRLKVIQDTIDDLKRRLDQVNLQEYLKDHDEQELTAFRLAKIGENANKLSDELKARNPDIPWSKMYTLRNMVSHEYHKVDHRLAWAAVESLEPIAEMARAELLRLDLERAREERAQRDRDGGRDR